MLFFFVIFAQERNLSQWQMREALNYTSEKGSIDKRLVFYIVCLHVCVRTLWVKKNCFQFPWLFIMHMYLPNWTQRLSVSTEQSLEDTGFFFSNNFPSGWKLLTFFSGRKSKSKQRNKISELTGKRLQLLVLNMLLTLFTRSMLTVSLAHSK